MMRKIYIYALGMLVLGLAHDVIKSSVPHGAIFLLIVLAYCGIVRLIAERFGKP